MAEVFGQIVVILLAILLLVGPVAILAAIALVAWFAHKQRQ